MQRGKRLVAGQLAHWRLRAAEIRGALTQHDLSAAPVDSLGREGDRVTWLGVFVNLALALAKFAAGALGRSAVMVADAAHSLSDLISDFVTLWAVRIARLPPDIFFRVHRSYIVNIQRVARLKRAGDNGIADLDSPVRRSVPVSRSRLPQLREQLTEYLRTRDN